MQAWIIYSILSALMAALVAIFGKIGLKNIDSTLATTIRSMVMAGFLIIASISLKKFNNFSFELKDWILIILAGIAGALSWLFYFLALKSGDATKVVAIDRMSLVFVAIFAFMFLGEGLNWQQLIGVTMMVGGAILVSIF